MTLDTVAVITIAGLFMVFKKHLKSKSSKIAKAEPTNNAQQEITTDNGSTTIIDNHVYNILYQ